MVYSLICADKDRNESYVGETNTANPARVTPRTQRFRRTSKPPATVSTFNPEEVVNLGKEERWFERGVLEAIWEKVEQPSLNKKGGLRFLLSHAWDQALKDIPRRLSQDQSTGSQT